MFLLSDGNIFRAVGRLQIEIKEKKPYFLTGKNDIIVDCQGKLTGYLSDFRNVVTRQGDLYDMDVLRQMFAPAENKIQELYQKISDSLRKR